MGVPTPAPPPQSAPVETRADFSGIDDQKIVQTVLEKWTYLNTIRRQKLWFWQECQFTWERKFGETWGEIMDNRSHRYIPLGFDAVETVVAQWMQSLVPNGRFFKPVGRNQEAQFCSASLEAKMRWDHYRMNFRKTFARFCKAAAIMGNVPWTMKWHTESVVVPDQEMLAAKQEIESYGIEVEVNDPAAHGFPTKTALSFQGARLVVGDIFNYVQDRHPDDDRFSFRCYRSGQNKEWLQARWAILKDANGKPVYKNLDQIQNGSLMSQEVGDSLRRAIDASIGYSQMPQDKVELITFCGDLVVPGEGFFPNVMGVIANRQHLLRFCANPFAHGLPPWQMFTLIQDPHDPHGYGTGVIEPGLGLFDLVNVRANQTVDANSLAVTPPLGVVIDGITDQHNIVWGPGESLYMRAPGNIAAIQVPKEALSLGLQEIQYYKSEIAAATGASGGISASADPASATEAAGIQKTTSALQAERALHIQEDALIPMLRMQASLNQQLMDPNSKVLVRLLADENGQFINPSNGQLLPRGMHWAEVGANDIQGEFDFEIIGASQLAQTMQQQQNQMNFINSVRQDPVFQRRIDMDKFYITSMEKLGFTDAWSYIRTDEQVAEYDAQQAQLAQQQAMGAQGGPSGAPQGGGPPGNRGIPSLPGNAGGGGSAARAPYPEQLAGPSRMG
jgi:hypothetical protein